MIPERDEKGRLLPGNTANPKGRPKRKSFAEYFSEEEREDLINKIKSCDKPEIWMKQIEQIFGKAKQPLVGGDEDDEPIKITGINYILPNEDNSKTDKETASGVGEA